MITWIGSKCSDPQPKNMAENSRTVRKHGSEFEEFWGELGLGIGLTNLDEKLNITWGCDEEINLSAVTDKTKITDINIRFELAIGRQEKEQVLFLNMRNYDLRGMENLQVLQVTKRQ